MATRGFEFAYMLDGKPGVPLVRDWAMAADAAGYKKGDLLVVDSNGRLDKAAGSVQEVTAVCVEAESGAVSDDDLLEVAIITRNQVWRCSMDATTTAALKGYTKTLDLVDENTIDADDLSNGTLCPVDVSKLDDEGNVLAYVIFLDTTFGNT